MGAFLRVIGREAGGWLKLRDRPEGCNRGCVGRGLLELGVSSKELPGEPGVFEVEREAVGGRDPPSASPGHGGLRAEAPLSERGPRHLRANHRLEKPGGIYEHIGKTRGLMRFSRLLKKSGLTVFGL